MSRRFVQSAGLPTKPSSCLVGDSTNPRVPNAAVCLDTGALGGEGECTQGPTSGRCSVASGHGHRYCSSDADCGGAAGSCQDEHRLCFLTGPFSSFPAAQGTGTLVAPGLADPPVADAFTPRLAAVGCAGPSTSAAVNNVLGLPGPVREITRAAATFRP